MLASRPNVPRSRGALASLVLCSACSLTVSLEELSNGGGAGGTGGAGTSTSATTSTSSGTAGAGGGLACPAGTLDCDADGTTCEDLATDVANCGVCGRDCLGGECIDGRCEPVLLWQGDAVDGRTTGIDQSADNVFACSTLGVVRIPKVGGAPLFLTMETAQPRIDVDGAYAYFTSGSLRRVPLSGGTVDVLAQAPSTGARGVRVDGTHAYYVRYNSADSHFIDLVRVPQEGGTSETIPLDGTEAWGVQLDDTYAYATAETGIYRIPKSSFSTAEQIWTGSAGGGMVILEGIGFVLGAGLWRVDLATGDGTLLDGELSSGEVATDGERLFYTLYNTGEIGRIELDGSGRTPMANARVGVDVLVVDDQAIYFTQHVEQSVLRLAK